MSDLITDAMVEAARQAVEDEAIERRDARIFVLCGNGISVRERDGSESSVHRMRTDEAIRIALKIVAPAIAAKALRDAADELRRLDDGRTGGYYEAGRHIIQRLDARADGFERGES